MNERWLSLAEIATHLGVSKDSVYRWLDRNMPAHKVGRQWKFKVDEVDAWVRSGQADLMAEPTSARKREMAGRPRK
jgi:excisionase family DNA binding protein